MTTNSELQQMLVGYLEERLQQLKRENSILREMLKDHLVSQFMGDYIMSEEEAEKKAEMEIAWSVAHNEGAE